MLQPMAIGAIGGLVLGLMVTLFLLPCLYVIFAREGSSSLPSDSLQTRGRFFWTWISGVWKKKDRKSVQNNTSP